jgi:hypothetical protein
VEKLIISAAPGLTTGQLRALARRAVLSADPKAARRRKEKALADARVEMFPETAGTAALAGRDLPPAAALAADKHLTALAQAMKAAGQPGTLDILRAWAYLHLLSGKPAATLLHATQHNPTPAGATPGDATPATPPWATSPRASRVPPAPRRAPPRAPPAAARTAGRPGRQTRTAGHPAGQARTADGPTGQARTAFPAVPMPERTSPRHRVPRPVPPGRARTASPPRVGCAARST